jgi:hypothetical protein
MLPNLLLRSVILRSPVLGRAFIAKWGSPISASPGNTRTHGDANATVRPNWPLTPAPACKRQIGASELSLLNLRLIGYVLSDQMHRAHGELRSTFIKRHSGTKNESWMDKIAPLPQCRVYEV